MWYLRWLACKIFTITWRVCPCFIATPISNGISDVPSSRFEAFGVCPVQTLERPFTDADGARLMSALRFDGDNTIAERPMVELLAQIQHMLIGARARAGSGDSLPRGRLMKSLQARYHKMLICAVYFALDFIDLRAPALRTRVRCCM